MAADLVRIRLLPKVSSLSPTINVLLREINVLCDDLLVASKTLGSKSWLASPPERLLASAGARRVVPFQRALSKPLDNSTPVLS